MAADNQSCLITALKQHDRSAWSAAVDHHLHEVYGFVFHLVGSDRAVAEDVNQETWLQRSTESTDAMQLGAVFETGCLALPGSESPYTTAAAPLWPETRRIA